MINNRKKSYREKERLLNMKLGTATHRLRKAVMFSLVQKLNLDTCFQCNTTITSVDDLSIEHRVPWQKSADPLASFFDLENIAFSHLKCNVKAAASAPIMHGTRRAYQRIKCRCEKCAEAARCYTRQQMQKYRAAGRDQSRKNYKSAD